MSVSRAADHIRFRASFSIAAQEQIAFDLNHFVIHINRVKLLYYNMLDRIHALRLDHFLIQPKSDPI